MRFQRRAGRRSCVNPISILPHDARFFWSPRLTSQNFSRYVVRADEKLTAFVEPGDRTDVKPKVKIRIRVVDGEFGSEVLKVDRY